MIALGQLIAFLVLMMESESGSQLVPQIPSNIKLGVTSTFNLWTHALRQQKDAQGQPIQRSNVDIRTLLSPNEMLVVNLAPMDGPHPLYSNDYIDLRTEFLLDYMILESVRPDDERMTQPDGLSVPNLNGKSITFRKDPEGKITVEGIDVEKTETLSDGTTVYSLSNFLFDHRARTETALVELRRKEPEYGPFGRPLGPPLKP